MLNQNQSTIKLIAPLLMAVLGALVFLTLFSQMTIKVQGLEFDVRAQINNRGTTQVEIPPLGLIRADTHKTPVKIVVRLENIDFNEIQKMLQEAPDHNQLLEEVSQEINQVMIAFVIKVMALAAVGGAFGVVLSQRRNPWDFGRGVLIALLITAVLMAGTYRTYNYGEFRHPQYEGVLRAAPWMVSFAEEALSKIETLGQQLQTVAANLNGLYQQIDQLQPIGNTDQDIRVLHITDIHNNPAAMDFVERVTELFQVDLIIDTGDISDFGTPLESLLLTRLSDTPVPYLFVAGNHDSPEIITQMQSLPGVTVLDGIIEIHGLRILGVPDPSSASTAVEPPTTPEISDHAVRIMEVLSDTEAVDIIAVHNHRIAHWLAGSAPVIMFGHNHQQLVEKKSNSVLINSGSTGASGLQGLQSTRPSHYSVSLLHFRPTAEGAMTLMAVDSLKVEHLIDGFSLNRQLFGNGQDAGVMEDDLHSPIH